MVRVGQIRSKIESMNSFKRKEWLSPDVLSLDTVKLVAEHVRDSPPLLLVRTHLSRTFSVVSAEFQTQCCASSHVRFKSVALCQQVCFVRLRIDTCKSRFDILHGHGLQHTLVWMPIPSQIDCRHGSRESLRIPVLSRGVSSPSLGNASCQGLQFCFGGTQAC